jgi:hypothetical protein
MIQYGFMDSLLKTFSIGHLLRSVFSGIFFVISCCVAIDFRKCPDNEGKSFLTLLLLTSLFAGVTGYGIHRSVIYPFIEWAFNAKWATTLRKRVPLISIEAIDNLFWRWDPSEAEAMRDLNRINERLDAWADYIHLQFNSAVCIALGAVVMRCLVPGEYAPSPFLIGLAVTLFVAALVSNWRSHSVVDYIRKANVAADKRV